MISDPLDALSLQDDFYVSLESRRLSFLSPRCLGPQIPPSNTGPENPHQPSSVDAHKDRAVSSTSLSLLPLV